MDELEGWLGLLFLAGLGATTSLRLKMSLVLPQPLWVTSSSSVSRCSSDDGSDDGSNDGSNDGGSGRGDDSSSDYGDGNSSNSGDRDSIICVSK